MKDITYYEKTDTATQKAYLNLHSNCSLCSSALELKFEPTTDGSVKEEATCPSCELRTRAKTHTLQ